MYGELYGEIIKTKNINDYLNVPDIKFFEKEIPYGDLSKLTTQNEYFRHVINTTDNHQVVLMSIIDDIGEEIHPNTDQFFRIESGKGVAILNGKKIELKDGIFLNVAKGTKHNIINQGKAPLKLYTIYSPPQHEKGLVEQIKK